MERHRSLGAQDLLTATVQRWGQTQPWSPAYCPSSYSESAPVLPWGTVPNGTESSEGAQLLGCSVGGGLSCPGAFTRLRWLPSCCPPTSGVFRRAGTCICLPGAPHGRWAGGRREGQGERAEGKELGDAGCRQATAWQHDGFIQRNNLTVRNSSLHDCDNTNTFISLPKLTF